MALIEGERPTHSATVDGQTRPDDAAAARSSSSTPAPAAGEASCAAATASTAELQSPPSPPPYVSLTELPKLSRVFSANAPVTDGAAEVATQPQPTAQMQMSSVASGQQDDAGFDSDATMADDDDDSDDSSSGPGNVVDHSKYAQCSLDERRKSMSQYKSGPPIDEEKEAEKKQSRPVKVMSYTAEAIQAGIGCLIGVALCGCFGQH
ncbi:hypothetical protein SYNPS1DRAFT_27227 [Syncephalis pseudoplumigaleata]|uniref:Uncharacterized protein n=1 Tax=Syncephalis pseudoplumigaleata TaxID=1712513 RepID=A0A4P9Z635_9FUNG|nr:hypothetical protein SYNPS1DRAFT_27227 [Syncephalis pseudoplumigaleata]|eukprot:RKP27110.1 hypothetical protein SYNPS1DRAFT_27227 [Syncephalis pseudoplumigaleata]